MTAEKKEFPTLVIASLVTGVMMYKGSFGDVHEAAEWLFGGPVWTHEFVHGPTSDIFVSRAFEQFPDLPTRVDAEKDWQAAAEKAIDSYGAVLSVAKGKDGRQAGPMQTIRDIKPDAVIIPVVKP
jgi:hypothetical protein